MQNPNNLIMMKNGTAWKNNYGEDETNGNNKKTVVG